MILNMDKIQFENRAEIGAIIKALEEWQEDHGKDETVQELISKLDVMSKNRKKDRPEITQYLRSIFLKILNHYSYLCLYSNLFQSLYMVFHGASQETCYIRPAIP